MKAQQVYEYVLAVQQQVKAEDSLNAAFCQLNPDNYIVSTASPLVCAYTNLVMYLLEPAQFGWLEWYMYDADFGSLELSFSVNNEMLCIRGMSFYKFWEIVNNV